MTIAAGAGHGAATNAGDLLFSLAFETLTTCEQHVGGERALRACQVLARAARTLAHGEALQAAQERDTALAEVEYLERCAAKTAVLFDASLHLGALLAGASDAEIEALRAFGIDVGTAFQIADDILDCGHPEAEQRLGKRPGADVRDGTITLPMIRAFSVDAELTTILAHPVEAARVPALLERIRQAGGLDSARATAHELRARAASRLPALDPRFDVDALHAIAAASVERVS